MNKRGHHVKSRFLSQNVRQRAIGVYLKTYGDKQIASMIFKQRKQNSLNLVHVL